MKVKNFIYTTAFLAFCSTMNAQYTEEINSNRPGQSMSAFAVGKTIFQVEGGLNGIYEKHDILRNEAKGGMADLQLRYGAFVEELEFIADMQYREDNFQDMIYNYYRHDFSKLVLGAKYLIYDPDKYYKPKPNLKSWWANRKFKWRKLIPSVAVYGGVNVLPNNTFSFPEDKVSFKPMLLLQHHFGKWVWVNNFMFDKVGTKYPSKVWITTFTRGFTPSWSGFFEFQGIKSDYYADAIVRTGAAYLAWENLQFDASISTNVKNTPYVAYGGIGVSWRFNGSYKDVLLPGKGDREDELKAQDEKKKKEQEKRKKDREKRKKALQEVEFPAEAPAEPAPQPTGGN